ncbi:MAG: SPFH domain-containing protein [Lachnospiraceae bacterium]|nr:SPFH domain-containing protein [Lachnospiraceae bacterium]
MGFIKAFAGSVSGELANQWKEFYTCDSLPSQVLIRRATHMVSGRSSNKHADTDDISKGSTVIVNKGQCAILVSQGQILDVAAEPGAYTWEDGTSPSFFSGSISDVIKKGWERFSYGGLNPIQQRIYYVNMKELIGCKFGTPQPVPFRIVDGNIGLDLDTSVRCNGTYTMHVSDPVVLYTAIAGNVADEFTVDQMNDQLRAEFVQALQPTFAQLSGIGIRPSALPGQTKAISDAMKSELDQSWTSHYGLSLTSVQIISATIPEEDQKMLQDVQRQAVYKNQGMAGAALVQAQAEAMRTAAGNSNGAMMGFAGMNMALNAGGINANQFFQNQNKSEPQQSDVSAPKPGEWFCPKCGTKSDGNFCPKCGAPKPDF